jgi:anti-anti-sigma factor
MLSWPTIRGKMHPAPAGSGARKGPLMKFELRETSPGFVVLTCHGGLSWEDRELLAASVEQYVIGRESPRGLVLDMTGVEFVNSAGLVQRVRGRGGRLAFAAVPPTILRLLNTVGMDRLARFADSVSEALALLSHSGDPAQDHATESTSP